MPAQFTDPLPDTQHQQAHQQHQQRHSQSAITTSTSANAAFHAGAGTHQRKKSVVAATLPSSASFPNGGFAAQQLEGNGSHRILTGTSRIQSGKDVSGQVIFDEREVMQSKEDGPNGVVPTRRLSVAKAKGFSLKKIGLLAGLGFVLITLTRWLMPHDVKGYDPTHLTPRDYLNASISDPAPFEFCPVFGPGDPVAERRGQWGLLRSRLHQGSNARVQKVIQKGLSGLPVTISVLGSSVSACHGAGDDPVASKCYPSKFFEWWNSIFPHPASELTNGASRKTDSAYYAYCSGHHLPDSTDLVVLEFDSADPNDPDWLSHFELLVRSILVRPEMPAVIILGHFSPQLQAQNGFAGPELLHTVVAQFYDVPHISTKGILYHDYLANPEGARKAFYVDPILASPGGHDLIADVLISYMQQQICSGWAANMGHAFDVPYMGEGGSDVTTGGPQLLGGVGLRKGAQGVKEGDGESVNGQELKHANLKVPAARIHDRPSDLLQFREIDPFCVSANDLINPLPPSLFYGSGWHAFHPAKGTHDERHYWYAEQPTSRIRIPMRLSAGDVAIYYIQNPENKPAGSALCWVDDNVAGGVELQGNAEVSEPTPTLTIIDRHVAKGSHFVECQLLGEEGKASPPFKILGIFAT